MGATSDYLRDALMDWDCPNCSQANTNGEEGYEEGCTNCGLVVRIQEGVPVSQERYRDGMEPS